MIKASLVIQTESILNYIFWKALDEGKEVRAIFCDISKAFDRVWHNGLLLKLRSVSISSTLLHWFADYLDNRKQRVVLPGATSRWNSTNAIVPQGFLGPLLFLVYINNIDGNINSKIRLFADDTSLFIIVDNPIDAARKLNSDLEMIHQWATKWLVTFNPSKTESLLQSRKQNRPRHPEITMSQQLITEINSHKHLGITLNGECSCHEHLSELKSKAWQRINIMRKLKFILDRQLI